MFYETSVQCRKVEGGGERKVGEGAEAVLIYGCLLSTRSFSLLPVDKPTLRVLAKMLSGNAESRMRMGSGEWGEWGMVQGEWGMEVWEWTMRTGMGMTFMASHCAGPNEFPCGFLLLFGFIDKPATNFDCPQIVV